MNLLEINARIRQRPPFQMIERVTALEPGKSADGIKCVPVVPGDRLEIHAEMVRGGAGVYTFDVTISCDGGVRAKGELMFTAVAQDSIYA